MDRCMDRKMYGLTEGCTERQMGAQTERDEYIDRQTDAWVGMCMYRLSDGWTDGQTGKYQYRNRHRG